MPEQKLADLRDIRTNSFSHDVSLVLCQIDGIRQLETAKRRHAYEIGLVGELWYILNDLTNGCYIISSSTAIEKTLRGCAPVNLECMRSSMAFIKVRHGVLDHRRDRPRLPRRH